MAVLDRNSYTHPQFQMKFAFEEYDQDVIMSTMRDNSNSRIFCLGVRVDACVPVRRSLITSRDL